MTLIKPTTVKRKPDAIATMEDCGARETIRIWILSGLQMLLKRSDLCTVNFTVGERTTIYEVDLSQEDFGRMMGAKGKHINAMRVLVSALAATHGIRAIVCIKDEGRFF